jgi:hypothetical protein
MTTPASSRLAGPPRRMLTKRQAADYLGVTVNRFVQICTVPAIDLGGSIRWDVVRLDEWIDGMANSATLSKDDWLSRMGDDD